MSKQKEDSGAHDEHVIQFFFSFISA